MQIDAMALREIIRAAEIIEQAKRASVNREFQHTWKELELALSSEEFSTLYHAMTPRVSPRMRWWYDRGNLPPRSFSSTAVGCSSMPSVRTGDSAENMPSR